MQAYVVVAWSGLMLFLAGLVGGRFFPDTFSPHASAKQSQLELTLSLPLHVAARRCRVPGATFDRHSRAVEGLDPWLVSGLEHTVRSLDDCFERSPSLRNPLPIIWLRIEADRVGQAGINGADISTPQRECVERTLKSLPPVEDAAGVSVAFPYPDCELAL